MVYGIITYSLFGKTYMLNMYKQVTFIKIDINSVFLFNLMNIIFANRDNIELMRLLLLMIYSLFDRRVHVINVNFVLLVVFYSCVCIGLNLS